MRQEECEKSSKNKWFGEKPLKNAETIKVSRAGQVYGPYNIEHEQ